MLFSRPTWEGGQYNGDEQSRLAALRLAMELGADHIEFNSPPNQNQFPLLKKTPKISPSQNQIQFPPKSKP